MVTNQRYYIHGDQQESDPSHFYCSSCDAFFEEGHFFNSDEKCCDHWGKYDHAIKMLGNSINKHREFERPINAANLFSRNLQSCSTLVSQLLTNQGRGEYCG